MPIEAGKYSDQEKKQLEKSEKLKTAEKKNLLDQQKAKAEIREHIKADEALTRLHDLLDDHDIDLDIADVEHIGKALNGEELSHDDIEDILEKIDEIENTQDVDSYLPPEFRISKQQYHDALINDIVRLQTITKIDTALGLLANQATGGDGNMGLNIFSGYMAMLDKKLISIQENHIDMKDHLEEIEQEKKPSKKLSLWQKIIKFLKELI
ncbi:hypothetical protein OAN96_01520 [Candidatus Gracilibacteria bacterium]|nr:hypothetical protein [Candidatus Gracilibacteria bacterium]